MEGERMEKIILTKIGDTGFIFNASDYMKLRKDFKILGSIVGTNCVNFRVLEGLPCRLTPFETQLVLEEGIGVLVKKSYQSQMFVTEKTVEEDKKNVEEILDQQLDLCKEDKIKEQMHFLNKIVEGKRNKMRKMGIPEKEIKLTVEDVIKEMKNDTSQFQKTNCLVQVTHQPVFSHTCEIVTDFHSSKSLKYRVFKNLWKKGFYITSGEAFGADYLAYPGDPMYYHASHVVHVITKKTSVETLDMIAKCRLSVTVNKILWFAYEEDEEVRYSQVEWINPSSRLPST